MVSALHRTLLVNSHLLFSVTSNIPSDTIESSLLKMPRFCDQQFNSRPVLTSAHGIPARGSHLRVHLSSPTSATPVSPSDSVHPEQQPISPGPLLSSISLRYPISSSNFAFALGGHHSSPIAKPSNSYPNGLAPTSSVFTTTSMGQSPSLIRSSVRSSEPSPTSRRHTLSSLGRPNPTPTTKVIPSDNIFVPIQPDDVLGQVPIHIKHPLPRTGIEDSEDKPIQTNRFYANAFLGKQDQPVWTHPYFLWWGKGGSDPTQFATWGMNISHAENEDLVFGPGEPPKVSEFCL